MKQWNSQSTIQINIGLRTSKIIFLWNRYSLSGLYQFAYGACPKESTVYKKLIILKSSLIFSFNKYNLAFSRPGITTKSWFILKSSLIFSFNKYNLAFSKTVKSKPTSKPEKL